MASDSVRMEGDSERGIKRKAGCVDNALAYRDRDISADFIIGSVIGRGSYGVVRRCRERRGEHRIMACKTLLKEGNKGARLHKEVAIMQHVSSGHRNIVNLQGVYEDEEKVHLVMDLSEKGSLSELMDNVDKFGEERAVSVMVQIMQGLTYLHDDMGVVHRDIKPSNILINADGVVKVSDFGMSERIVQGERHLLRDVWGTAAYMAPEMAKMVVDGQKGSCSYSAKVDVWSSGILLFKLLMGTLPFDGDSIKDVYGSVVYFSRASMEQRFRLSERWTSLSLSARDLISNMLFRDDQKRLSARQVLDHRWIAFHTRSVSRFTISPRVEIEEEEEEDYDLILTEADKKEEESHSCLLGFPLISEQQLGHEKQQQEEDEVTLSQSEQDPLDMIISSIRGLWLTSHSGTSCRALLTY